MKINSLNEDLRWSKEKEGCSEMIDRVKVSMAGKT